MFARALRAAQCIPRLGRACQTEVCRCSTSIFPVVSATSTISSPWRRRRRSRPRSGAWSFRPSRCAASWRAGASRSSARSYDSGRISTTPIPPFLLPWRDKIAVWAQCRGRCVRDGADQRIRTRRAHWLAPRRAAIGVVAGSRSCRHARMKLRPYASLARTSVRPVSVGSPHHIRSGSSGARSI